MSQNKAEVVASFANNSQFVDKCSTSPLIGLLATCIKKMVVKDQQLWGWC